MNEPRQHGTLVDGRQEGAFGQGRATIKLLMPEICLSRQVLSRVPAQWPLKAMGEVIAPVIGFTYIVDLT